MSIGKIIVIVGLVLSLGLALVIGGGAYWWSNNKDEVLGQFLEEKNAGASFGKSTDNEGCFAESLQRHDTCRAMPCHLQNNLFLFGCLKESVPTSGFCDDVPAKAKFMETVTWRVSNCAEAGREESSYCNQLFGTMQRFCEA